MFDSTLYGLAVLSGSAVTSIMKYAKWNECLEGSIGAEILNLKEVEANLVDLRSQLAGRIQDLTAIAIALSFVRDAITSLLPLGGHSDSDA
jgi:hypothetical protein